MSVHEEPSAVATVSAVAAYKLEQLAIRRDVTVAVAAAAMIELGLSMIGSSNCAALISGESQADLLHKLIRLPKIKNPINIPILVSLHRGHECGLYSKNLNRPMAQIYGQMIEIALDYEDGIGHLITKNSITQTFYSALRDDLRNDWEDEPAMLALIRHEVAASVKEVVT